MHDLKKGGLKVKKLILVLVLSVFVVGLGAGSAMADSIMFPWLVKNNQGTFSLVSVVNTSATDNTVCPVPRLHYQYYYKADNQTGACTPQSFFRATSQEDIVSFDAAGVVSSGQALFNDQPPLHANVTYVPNQFDMNSAPAIARAFLLVDNNNSACFDHTNSASLYGEAMIIQISQGGAWGYVAYNGIGGGPSGPASEPYLGFNDELDLQGEVLRSPRFYDAASDDGEELEVTPTVLLPLNIFTTKMFVTPVNYSRWEASSYGYGAPYSGGEGARMGTANSRIQFCLRPYPTSSFPITSPCPSGLSSIDYVGEDCQTNGAAKCQIGGIYDNDEGPMNSNISPDVVCTAALDVRTPDLLLTQAQVDYLNSGAQGWTYVRSMVGSFYAPGMLGTRSKHTLSDSIVGKLDFTAGPFQLGSRDILGAVNDFKWIRNSASQYNGGWDMFRGINAIGEWSWDETP